MHFIQPKYYLSFLLVLLAIPVLSQEDDYAGDNVLRYEDFVYKPNIQTVQLHETSWEFAQPLLQFNSGQQLELSFDDLDADKKYYSLTVVHRDAKWNPSDLI